MSDLKGGIRKVNRYREGAEVDVETVPTDGYVMNLEHDEPNVVNLERDEPDVVNLVDVMLVRTTRPETPECLKNRVVIIDDSDEEVVSISDDDDDAVSQPTGFVAGEVIELD